MTSNKTNCAHIAYEAVLEQFVLAQEQRHALIFRKGHHYFLSLGVQELIGLLDKIEQDYQLRLYSGMVYSLFRKVIEGRIRQLRRRSA